jgi:hypothetical protein
MDSVTSKSNGEPVLQENGDLLSQWLARTTERAPTNVSPIGRTGATSASYAQQGLWLADQIATDGNRASVVQYSWRLRGPLDVAALRRAFEAILLRHEAWRTGFEQRDGNLYQHVFASARFDFAVEEIGSLDPKVVENRIVAAYRQPLDLARGLVARARVYTLEPQHNILLLTIHHIAFDGWSFGILQRELELLYSAALEIPPALGIEAVLELAALSPLTIGSVDYAAYQKKQIENGDAEPSVAYWANLLDGAPERLRLPFDKAQPLARSSAGDRVLASVSSDLNARIKSRAVAWSTTPFCLQLVSFLLVLARWTGERDVVIGIALAGRKDADIEGVIGLFVNVLPLRCTFNLEESVSEVIQRVHGDLLRMHDHDEVPFEYLLQRLAVPRHASYRPLVQVTVSSHEGMTSHLALAGLEVTLLPPLQLDVQEDLTLYFTSIGERLDAHIAYSTDLFLRESIEALSNEYLEALGRLCEEPTACVRDFGLRGGTISEAFEPEHAVASTTPTQVDDPSLIEIQRVLAEIWNKVLPKTLTSADDNFFAMGGTSLAALRACNHASSIFGVRVPVRKLFEAGTLRGLARVISDSLAADKKPTL